MSRIDPIVQNIRIWLPKPESAFLVIFNSEPNFNLSVQEQLGEHRRKRRRREADVPFEFIGRTVADYYESSATRWKRYLESKGWIIVDLYSALYIRGWNEKYEEIATLIDREVPFQDFVRLARDIDGGPLMPPHRGGDPLNVSPTRPSRSSRSNSTSSSNSC